MKYIVALFVVSCSALKCVQYADELMPPVHPRFPSMNAARADIGYSNFGKNWTLTCSGSDICHGEAYIYRYPDGTKTGFIWTTCWSKDTIRVGECYNEKHAYPSGDALLYSYRCGCDTDLCHHPDHLRASFYEVFYGIRNNLTGPFNPYAIIPPFIE